MAPSTGGQGIADGQVRRAWQATIIVDPNLIDGTTHVGTPRDQAITSTST